MKRREALALALLAPFASAQEAQLPVVVNYAGSVVHLSPPAEKIGEECFVPVKEAEKFGWNVSVRGSKARVVLNGKALDTFVRRRAGLDYVPLRALIAEAGGFTEWKGDNSLVVFARVNRVAVSDFAIEVDLSGPASLKLFTMNNPPRVVVDVLGGRIDQAKAPTTSGEFRMSQFDENTVRIVAQTASMVVPQGATNPHGSIRVFWTGAKTLKPEPYRPGGAVVTPMELGTAAVASDSEDETVVLIPFQGGQPGAFSVQRDPAGLHWVHFPNAKLAAGAEMPELTSRAFKSARMMDRPGGGLMLRIELEQPKGIHVAANGPNMVVRISKPRNSGGGFAGKIIVVDAGHGGKDPGATWGTLLEKDINLDIARHVGRILKENGATVIMTREDDTFIELNDRPRIANDSNAHFFISIHTNSNNIVNSTSGTFTYYHMQDPDSRALAECIQAEVVKVTGLPDHGARSDSEVYKVGGFAVLRHSRMPAVLFETAYINHERDRQKLMDPEFRRKVAEAIVRGIEVYIGNENKGRR